MGHLHLLLNIQPGLQMANPVTFPEVYPSSSVLAAAEVRSDTQCDLFPRVLWAAVMIRCWVEVPPKQVHLRETAQPTQSKTLFRPNLIIVCIVLVVIG